MNVEKTDAEIAAILDLHEEPGMVGAFTRAQARGAWLNGSRVEKHRSKPGDTFAEGTQGILLGSMEHQGQFFYFVMFDPMPGVVMGILGDRLRQVRD